MDDSGQLDDCLPPETREIEVLVDGNWKTQTIDLSSKSSLLVIDVSRQTGLVGSTLGGRYRIDATLGAGGMGIVYRATDTRLGRDVAIKMLSEQFRTNEEARRLFLEEARQMAPLSHPHLVGIYDVTTIDGYDLMVTELVTGQNLDELLQARGPFEIDDALRIAYQLTVAVGFLHDQGMIHRDLKPANAILESGNADKNGVKLIDFGLARSLDHLVIKGTAVRGTPAYMAPEQILGTGLSSATDIYQLGATFYELLSNELPIDFETGNFLANVNKDPRPLGSIRSGLPSGLAELIHTCLDKDPQARPTARQLAEGLGELYFQRTGTAPLAGSSTGAWTAKSSAVPSSSTTAKAPELQQNSPGESSPEADKNPKSQRAILIGLTLGALAAAAVLIALVVFSSDAEKIEPATALATSPTATEPIAEQPIAEPHLEKSTESSALAARQVGESVGEYARLLAEQPRERTQEIPEGRIVEQPTQPVRQAAAPRVAENTSPKQAAPEPPPSEPAASEPAASEPAAPRATEEIKEVQEVEALRLPKIAPRLAPKSVVTTEDKEEKEEEAPRPRRAPRGF